MATNPEDIQLTLEQKKLLARFTDNTGRDWNQVLEDFLVFSSVQEGVDQANAGDLLSEEEVFSELEETLMRYS